MDTTLRALTTERTADAVLARSSWLGCVRNRWPDGHLTPLADVLAAHAIPVTSPTDASADVEHAPEPRATNDLSPTGRHTTLVVDLTPALVLEILDTANLVPAGLHGQMTQLITSRLLHWDQQPAGRHWGTVWLTHPGPDSVTPRAGTRTASASAADRRGRSPK